MSRPCPSREAMLIAAARGLGCSTARMFAIWRHWSDRRQDEAITIGLRLDASGRAFGADRAFAQQFQQTEIPE